MLSIFEKLDAVKINCMELIAEEDKQFCDKEFKAYQTHLSVLQKMYVDILSTIHSHENKIINPQNPYLNLYSFDKVKDPIIEMIQTFHRIFTANIEGYFKNRYNLVFDTYYYKESNSTYTLTVEEIVDNIIEQSGTDLRASGKQQIISRFQECFQYSRYFPTLKNNKIQFPDFYWLGYGSTPSLDYSDKKIPVLLDALSLFLFDSNKRPESFDELLRQWKDEFDFNQSYTLEGNLTLRFFKNRRIDVAFTSLESAEKFWQFFELGELTQTK
ncbi:MAG: hypothetical protein JST87_18525 [Bacteroidetes bacterium]|nr:hypothetical protein [Bacteroidota bacterium]